MRTLHLRARSTGPFPHPWDSPADVPGAAAGTAAPAAKAAKKDTGKMLAVLTFAADRSARLEAQQVVMLTDYFRQLAFREAGHYGIMTRENMEVLLKAHGTSLEKCSEAQCEVEFGQKIGADVVVSGGLSKLGSYLFLNLKAHDTAQGVLLGAQTIKAKDVDAMVDAMDEAAKALFAPL